MKEHLTLLCAQYLFISRLINSPNWANHHFKQIWIMGIFKNYRDNYILIYDVKFYSFINFDKSTNRIKHHVSINLITTLFSSLAYFCTVGPFIGSILLLPVASACHNLEIVRKILLLIHNILSSLKYLPLRLKSKHIPVF